MISKEELLNSGQLRRRQVAASEPLLKTQISVSGFRDRQLGPTAQRYMDRWREERIWRIQHRWGGGKQNIKQICLMCLAKIQTYYYKTSLLPWCISIGHFKTTCLFGNERLELNSPFILKNKTYILLISETNHAKWRGGERSANTSKKQFIPKENKEHSTCLCEWLNIPPSSLTSCCSDQSRPSKIGR